MNEQNQCDKEARLNHLISLIFNKPNEERVKYICINIMREWREYSHLLLRVVFQSVEASSQSYGW